ncbi:MAG: hypothetical protein HY737_04620 [Candidatus Omnitrophica bacterium]|nr:hypothetical protein [Candidatus Omnitrophota bacterium]
MKIAGMAYALPSRQVTNEMVIEEFRRQNRKFFFVRNMLAKKLREALEHSGTRIRYHRAPGETAVDFALQAGREALERAEIAPEAVDLVIYTGVGRAWLEPAMAHLFKSLLGLRAATCFDVTDACASWVRSLSVAKSFLDQGTYKTALIINAEFNCQECGGLAPGRKDPKALYYKTPLRRPQDLYYRVAGYTIGEAATATVLVADGQPDNFHVSLKSWEQSYDLCQITLPNAEQFLGHGGSRSRQGPLEFYAAPKELLAFVVEKLTEHYQSDAQLSKDPHDIIFCHDVSDVSTSAGIKQFVPEYADRVYRTYARFGNTVSASIPLGMAMALKEGKLQPGMRVLIVCGSAGVTTGFCKFTYVPAHRHREEPVSAAVGIKSQG